MTDTVEIPIWLFLLILLFAAVTFASHFLFPSVRWFLRRRLENAVAQLNTRLARPIEPFKLAARHDMIQRLTYDPDVSRAIVEHARSEGLPEDVAFQLARRYAREIVPSFSAFAYFGFGIRVARLLANALYDVRTDPGNDRVIAEIPAEATVVFVMNHRSNMDYVLVTYLAAQASALSYAVGEWARFWPLSRLIKSMGAYFIRRKSRNLLYRRVLARYVQLATAGGVTQAVFPEGGLSLDGRLAPPKMGILAYVVQAGREGSRDVVFVPVAINYDRVLEDRVLVAANARGDRRFGAHATVAMRFVAKKLWLRLRGRFLRFGSAGVAFGVPLSLRGEGQEMEVEELAETLMHRIHDVMPQMGVPLLAQLLLEADGPLRHDELLARAEAAVAAKPQDFLLRPDETAAGRLAVALAHMRQRRFVLETAEAIAPAPDQREILQFYANSMSGAQTEIAAAAQ